MSNKVLTEKSVDPDPFVQFANWYNEHLEAGIAIPDTVSLGTASSIRKSISQDRSAERL